MIQWIITTVYCFHPCAGVWFLVCSKSLVPCSNSEFDEVKGDTLLNICIAGEKKLGVRYFVSPFVCKTSLTEHTSSAVFRSCYTFLSTLTENSKYNLIGDLKILSLIYISVLILRCSLMCASRNVTKRCSETDGFIVDWSWEFIKVMLLLNKTYYVLSHM